MTTTPEMVESVARAIYERLTGGSWDDLHLKGLKLAFVEGMYRDVARAAIEAHEAALAAAGLVIVPKEPTKRMKFNDRLYWVLQGATAGFFVLAAGVALGRWLT